MVTGCNQADEYIVLMAKSRVTQLFFPWHLVALQRRSCTNIKNEQSRDKVEVCCSCLFSRNCICPAVPLRDVICRHLIISGSHEKTVVKKKTAKYSGKLRKPSQDWFIIISIMSSSYIIIITNALISLFYRTSRVRLLFSTHRYRVLST